MNKSIKICISILLSFVFILSLVSPVYAIEVEGFKEGDLVTAGHFIYYSERKELIITGNGVITNLTPVRNAKGNNAVKITVGEGITSLPSSAFNTFSYVKNITLPNTLETIPNYCFKLCTSLEDITIPSGVKTINTQAFNGCTSLKYVLGCSGLTNIAANAFSGCSSLEGVSLSDGFTTFERDPFYGCTSLRYVIVPNSLSTSSANILVDQNTASKTHEFFCIVCDEDCWLRNSSEYEGRVVNSGKNFVCKAGTNLTYTYEPVSGKLTISGSGNFYSDFDFQFAEVVKTIDLSGYTNSKLSLHATTGTPIDCYQRVETVIIPSTVTSIDDNILTGADNTKVVIYGATNSAADTFASKKGYSFNSTGVVEAHKHIWNSGVIEVVPTCQSTGLRRFECMDPNCNETKTEVEAKTAHNYIVTGETSPTCTTPGFTAGTRCSICNTTFSSQTVIPALGHSYGVWTIDKDATCDTDGSYVRICGRCGEKDYDVMPAKGHSYFEEDWVTVVSETCGSDGSEERKCRACNKLETRIRRATGIHTIIPVDEVKATCISTGLTEGKKCSVCGYISVAQQIVDRTAHTYGSWNKLSNGSYMRECTVCHNQDIQNYKFDNGTITKEPTCTSTGIIVYKCLDNPEIADIVDNVPSLGHALDNGTITKEASCTSTGVMTYKCTRSGCSYSETSIIPVKSHTFYDSDWKVTVQETCGLNGLEERKCRYCDARETRVRLATGNHSIVSISAVKATCVSTGLTEGKKCSVCGYVSLNQQVLEKTNHTYGSWTKQSNGSYMRECSVCHNQDVQYYRFDGGTVTKQPTCSETGTKVYKCVDNRDIPDIVDVLPALGHVLDNGAVTKSATCTESGVMTYKCTRSGCTHTSTSVIPAKGHIEHIVPEVPATYDAEGYTKWSYCEICSATIVRKEVIPKLSKNEDDNPETGNNPGHDDKTDSGSQSGDTPSTPSGGKDEGVNDDKPTVSPSPNPDMDKPTTPNDEKVSLGSDIGYTINNGTILVDPNGAKYLVAEKMTTSELKKSAKIADKKSGGKYKITGITKKSGRVTGGTISYLAPYNKSKSSSSVAATVKIAGVKFKVTEIANNAFKSNKKLKSITIGSNVKKIGKNAFYGCKNLKTVNLKSKVLKSVGSKAFKGVYSKIKINVPKKKITLYKKYIKKAKAPAKAKYVKKYK